MAKAVLSQRHLRMGKEATVAVTNVLGVGVSAINMDMIRQMIGEWVERHESHYVCVATVHCIMEAQKSDLLKRIYNNASMVTPDGMPLVWMNHLAGQDHVGRVYGPNLMLALCGDSPKHGYRHFLYGGADGVPEKLRDTLEPKFPGIEIVGVYSPPFRSLTPEEDQEVVEMIKASQANVIWIGLGAPKQDVWMAEHIDRLPGTVMLGVGAAFDFHIGRKLQAPHWMQRMGLEWFFRLVTEPKRLWYRYLVYNPLFILGTITQKLGLKHYEMID